MSLDESSDKRSGVLGMVGHGAAPEYYPRNVFPDRIVVGQLVNTVLNNTLYPASLYYHVLPCATLCSSIRC